MIEEMIEYALGVISGVLILGFFILYKRPIDRAINQFTSTLQPKGSILEAEDNQLESWIDSLDHEKDD